MATVRVAGMGAVLQNLNGFRASVDDRARRAMTRSVSAVHADLLKNSFTAKRAASTLFRGGGVGGLAVDTGFVRASITSRTFEAGGKLVGAVGSPVKWLTVHEYGGTIKGKPWLRIPTVNAAKYAFIGRGNKSAPRGQRGGRALKSIPKSAATAHRQTVRRTFIHLDKHGKNLWIFLAPATRGGKPIPLYLLKREVHMPARHMFANSMQRMAPAILGVFRSEIAQAVKRA